MYQIELKQDNKSLVGFVKDRYAILAKELRLVGSTWIVTAVYAYDKDERVAWWLDVTT